MKNLSCFKAYDIRGKLGEELDVDVAYRIGRAYAQFLKPQTVVLGADVRLTSDELKQALAEGIMDSGSDVIDIGLAGTEEVYFATPHFSADGGICVTASHNPIDYNGMKLVKRDSKPISGDTGLLEIKRLAEENNFPEVTQKGNLRKESVTQPFVDKILSFVDPTLVGPIKLVVNAGNGAAGHVIDELEKRFAKNAVPITFIKVHHEPDGNFPNGIPNPLLPENRSSTGDAVKQHQADMGIAWDGDFDRCFLFDENGEFIEGYYIVGLLAEAFLQKNPGEKVIHDPRVMWNTQEIVSESGGIPILSKTGHAFIKEAMRAQDAIYGGEMSAHHYFRDFWYCDSGMIPWLLVVELISRKSTALSQLVAERIRLFPSSGEINNKLTDAKKALIDIEQVYLSEAINVDKTDGLSMDFENWRFNLRSSNTEPVVRLNVESRGDHCLMQRKTEELLARLKDY